MQEAAAAAAAAERQNDPMQALMSNPMIENMMNSPEMLEQMQSMVSNAPMLPRLIAPPSSARVCPGRLTVRRAARHR